jgi:hypothetical protein
MLLNNTIQNLTGSRLSRVWIKTGDSKTPLKGVWINESRVQRFAGEVSALHDDNESNELVDDHSWNNSQLSASAISSALSN